MEFYRYFDTAINRWHINLRKLSRIAGLTDDKTYIVRNRERSPVLLVYVLEGFYV